MAIEGTKAMGNWGKLIPVNEQSHITQTNDNSRDGQAVHITWNVPGEQAKLHDRFTSEGVFVGTDIAKRD